MKRSDPSYKGQSGYNPALLAIYDVWVLKFMADAVWKVPIQPVVTRYRRHLGRRHLDVGPGPATSSSTPCRRSRLPSRSWTRTRTC